MAHNHDGFSTSGLLAELSVSFHDELTASIQSAFGVAGELVVSEVSKLVLKAFRDVRDHLRKALLSNRELQMRLSVAQTELRVTRSRALETRDIAVNTVPSLSEPLIGSSLDVKETHEGSPSEAESDRCVQDVKPDLTGDQSSGPSQDNEDIKGENGIQQEASHVDQTCTVTATVPEASAVKKKGCVSFRPGHAAKVEDANQCDHTKSNIKQEFSSDSLTLAQSKLLADWRPEPLQSYQSDSYASSDSSALANPYLSQGDFPGMDFLASASSSQPDACQAALSQTDASSLTNPAHSLLFLTHSSGEGHPLDQSFSMPEEVRRNRGVLQPRLARHQHKSPRHSLYPPGRSLFHCSQCGRDFTRLEHLKIHQRIHTGEKPYACTECTACFRHSCALTRHLRIHTGEKPYLCTQCGKTFRNCGGLRFHQKAHARQIT